LNKEIARALYLFDNEYPNNSGFGDHLGGGCLCRRDVGTPDAVVFVEKGLRKRLRMRGEVVGETGRRGERETRDGRLEIVQSIR